jgi:hypothetical protein
VATLDFLSKDHGTAWEAFARCLQPAASNPHAAFHAGFLAIQSTIEAMLGALGRPSRLVSQITASRRQAERTHNSVGRSTRWPLGLLDDARQQRLVEEQEKKARESQREVDDLGRELRYTQQTVAGELAGWQEMHEKMGRRVIRELAHGVLAQERARLAGMMRALRKVQGTTAPGTARVTHGAEEGGDGC